ncbi:MAG: glutathione S-transferase family protein [Halieaceae bacterium]|nr:glutathione S-transferase family protein [Halieaceae bacterium]
MLTLHQYNQSPFNQKIQRMLNYKGVPFEEVYWRIADRSKVLKVSPSGKLPALEHDGKLVVDSTDMAYYIEEAFPQNPLIPDDPKLRGVLHAIEDWADESLYFYEMTLRFTTEGNAERNVPKLIENEAPALRWLLKRMIPRLLRKATSSQGIGRKGREQLSKDTRRHIEAVANMLGQDDWLLDNRLTLADLAVYAMFQCFRDADFVAAMLEEYPTVTAWMARIESETSTRA